jgi:hypothetical protein
MNKAMELAELHDATGWLHVPLQERIADKLGDILFASDEILDMIRSGRAECLPADSLLAIERVITTLYEQVNEAMAGITD